MNYHMSISLETIYNELQEIKKRLGQLERMMLQNEEEFTPEEIEDLNQLSSQMSKGDKILWNPD